MDPDQIPPTDADLEAMESHDGLFLKATVRRLIAEIRRLRGELEQNRADMAQTLTLLHDVDDRMREGE